MDARTPAAAVGAFKDDVQRWLSTVTHAVVRVGVGGYHPAPNPHMLTLSGDLVPLQRSALPLQLAVRLGYRVAQPSGSRVWRVDTTSYFFELADEDEREILAYHWHPDGRSPIVTPHLHLGPGAAVGRVELTRTHLPSGLVGLPAVLRFAIRDLGVRPLRDDWAAIFEAPEGSA